MGVILTRSGAMNWQTVADCRSAASFSPRIRPVCLGFLKRVTVFTHARHHLDLDKADAKQYSRGAVDCLRPYWLCHQQMILYILWIVCLDYVWHVGMLQEVTQITMITWARIHQVLTPQNVELLLTPLLAKQMKHDWLPNNTPLGLTLRFHWWDINSIIHSFVHSGFIGGI